MIEEESKVLTYTEDFSSAGLDSVEGVLLQERPEGHRLPPNPDVLPSGKRAVVSVVLCNVAQSNEAVG